MLWCSGDTKNVFCWGISDSHWLFSVPLIADWQGREKQCLECCHRQHVQEDQRPTQTGEHLGTWKSRKRSWGILFQFAIFGLCILKIRFFFFCNKNVLKTIAPFHRIFTSQFSKLWEKTLLNIYLEMAKQCMYACLNIFALDIYQ